MTTQFPLSFWDTSLLLAVTSIVLLITSEMLSPYYGRKNLLVDKKRLRQVSMVFSIMFLATVAINILGIILRT